MSRPKPFAKIAFAIVVVYAASQGWATWSARHAVADGGMDATQEAAPTHEQRVIIVPAGSVYGAVMADAGVDATTSRAIYDVALPIYDLARINAGREMVLTFPVGEGRPSAFTYRIDSERELRAWRASDSAWQAEVASIDYEVRLRTITMVVDSSLYAAGLAAGMDDAAIMTVAQPFQWSLDFAMDVRVGDTFRAVYEERYRNGEYAMPGRMLAGKFVNAGRAHYAFAHESAGGTLGHYDENGNSTQNMFLKAPVEFRYISSGFTTGLRYVAAFNVSTGHRAIDYAAAAGTPIRAVGDGTVVFAGWNGSYGNFVSIRHNGTYTTNYAHQSRMAVRVGQRVSQGQIIGYVGSTGFSTGPHLHYEMVKNGVKVNPLTETLPPGEPLAASEREAFAATVEEYRTLLDG